MLALLLAASLQAQPAPAPALRPELQPLAFLVGSCWRGSFPHRATDTHCFTIVEDGAAVRDLHVVEGDAQPYSGETIYRWRPESREIRYQYVGLNGVSSEGVATPTVSGLSFPEEVQLAGGRSIIYRSAWIRDGDDAYFASTEQRRGSRWRQLWRMRMVRIGPAPR